MTIGRVIKVIGYFIFQIQKWRLGKIGKKCKVFHRLILVNPKYVEIGDDFTAGSNVKLQVWIKKSNEEKNTIPHIDIGSHVAIMSNCQISCIKHVVIEDGVLLGENVFITDNNHGAGDARELVIPPHDRDLFSKGEVIIHKNVWIGRNVCIMPGVEIGEGAIIGANAVVTKDVPSFSVVAGVPATIIRQRTKSENGVKR